MYLFVGVKYSSGTNTGIRNQAMTKEIDAVITWVDGSDPTHQTKRDSFKSANVQKTINTSKGITRFINNGELEFCLRSLNKNAPWLRKIFIVTDNQFPNFLPVEVRSNKKIHIVDHKTIFKGYEENLPTFNSISIESMIHRIPGLSERYIYLNDDFVILKPVNVEDFFIDDKVYLKGTWKKIQRFGPFRLKFSQTLNLILSSMFKINRSMSLLQQMKAAELAGFNRQYLKSPHYPHPQIKNTILKYYDDHPDILNKNIKYRFRNLNQHVAVFLSNHLEIANKNAVIGSDEDCLMICFNRESHRLINKKITLLANELNSLKFLCIQSLEEASPSQKELLLDALRRKGLATTAKLNYYK